MSPYLHTPAKQNSGPWYARPSLGPRKAIAITVVMSFAFLWISLSPFGESLQINLAHRLEFLARNQLKRWPELHPRLRVFALDNKTLVDLGGEVASIEDWTLLFRALAKSGARSIMIDKVFGLPPANEPKKLASLREALASGPPVVGPSFLSDVAIQGRPPFPLDRPEYQLSYWLKGSPRPSWARSSKRIPYGPHPEIRAGFAKIGHSNNSGEAHLEPFLFIGEDKLLPHQTLLAVSETKLSSDGILINGTDPGLDSKGRVLLNLASKEYYLGKIFSLRSSFRKAREGAPLPYIEPGDDVVILTRMNQAETDMKDTPAGTMPAAFLGLAFVNSALTANWLRPVGSLTLFVLAFTLLGMAYALFCRPLVFHLLLWGTSLGLVVGGLGAFVFLGWVVPWLFPALALVTNAIVLFSERSRVEDKTAQKLRLSLQGLIEPRKLEELLKNPAHLQLQPSSQILSVMFIDIVSFSLAAESQTPVEVFQNLKSILDELTATVHRFGGVVDKSLGDGLLCFFGYQYGLSNEVVNHAEAALQCAITIQRENVARCLEAARTGRPVNPLRIGINTAEAFVGDVGGKDHVEFTVLGHGVNYAQRLETSCESFLIMASPSTMACVPPAESLEISSATRWIHAKHSEDFFEAVEVNPFVGKEELLEKAIQAYRDSYGIERSGSRYPVSQQGVILLSMPRGKGEVVNFSPGGLGVVLDEYYGRGVTFWVTLDSPDGSLRAQLAKVGLGSLLTEVRWGRPQGGKYLHGLVVKNLSVDQREAWIHCLSACLDSQIVKKVVNSPT